jgi:hypothetical protein
MQPMNDPRMTSLEPKQGKISDEALKAVFQGIESYNAEEKKMKNLERDLEYAGIREKSYIEQIGKLQDKVEELMVERDLPCDECQVQAMVISELKEVIDRLHAKLKRHVTYGEPIEWFIDEAKACLGVKG